MNSPRRVTTIVPAYDCLAVQPCTRETDQQLCIESSGDFHGRAHAILTMALQYEDIEVSLMVNTKWDVPETLKEVRHDDGPRGVYVMVHSSFQVYLGHHPHGKCCEAWENCYWDFNYTESDEPTRLLVTKGSDAVWAWLEARYESIMRGRP